MKNTIVFTMLIALPIMLACTCKSSKKNTDTTPEDVFIKNEMIVQLKEEVSPRQLVGAYQKYKLKTLKAISRETNLWLFTYDTSLIEPEKMLKTLKNSQFTTDVELNKKVVLRSGSRGN